MSKELKEFIIVVVVISIVNLIYFGLMNISYGDSYLTNENHFYELLLNSGFEPINTNDVLENNYLDIPMSVELQDYTNELCLEYDIPFELVIAIIDTESTFRSDLISSTNDYGLMQINKINHKWLKDGFGIDNLLDSKQNINAGVIIIQSLYHKYDGNLHQALMSYNMGEGGARKARSNGVYKTTYSTKVIGKYEMYKEM